MLLPVFQFLMPAQCPCCNSGFLEENLGSCSECRRKLESSMFSSETRCRQCFASCEQKAKNNCQKHSSLCDGRQLFFDQHISLYQLNKEWGRLLQSWKFGGNRYLYQSFLPLLMEKARVLSSWQIERIGYIDSGSKNLDLRPFQPCHDLAAFLAKLWKIPCGKDVFKLTKKQQSKNRHSERFFFHTQQPRRET